MRDDLGDRMKTYERVSEATLMPHAYHVIRVDGRAFHSHLRNAAKPFDGTFVLSMMRVGQALLHEVSGSVLAYGQSDEVSLVFEDLEPQVQPWFGGRIQKITSVAASIATASYANTRGTRDVLAQFDARVFTLPSAVEVANYLIWRQRDAVRNSVSMAAQAKFSTAQLHGKGIGQMQEMLFTQHGINWNDYADTFKRGWVAYRTTQSAPVTFTHKRTQVVETIEALQTVKVVDAAPHFSMPLLTSWLSQGVVTDTRPAESEPAALEVSS
jgi:tRNA(His) 5'-end guanylyltransferase